MDVEMRPESWAIRAAAWSEDGGEWRFVEHLGRPSLYLRDAFALVEGASLLDGEVRMDLAVSAEREFGGPTWRVQDPGEHEWFFLRPHQVGNPDATQYTPVFHGQSGWQLYHGPHYTVPVGFPIGDWFTVRILVAGRRAAVWVGDLATPALVVDHLKREPLAGGLGVSTGGERGIHVASVSWQPAEAPPAIDVPPVALEPVTGIVPSWSVSVAFREPATGTPLEHLPLGAQGWTSVDAEVTGLVDLNRIRDLADDLNAVACRATIVADHDRTVPFSFGFSDRATVYLNGRRLFHGDDGYRTRDYRFLGSIGYFDTVFLELREGPNDLVVVVAEDFGGWGLQARLDDPAGLAFG